MNNRKWNVGDWVLCTNVEPMEEGQVIAHSPEGEYVTVKTAEGNEYSYPECTDILTRITVEPVYNINPDDIEDIDTYFMHIMAAPKEIAGMRVKETSTRAMKLTNIKAKESVLFFLSLAPVHELNEQWRLRARTLSNQCNSIFPMIKGFASLKAAALRPHVDSSGVLN